LLQDVVIEKIDKQWVAQFDEDVFDNFLIA
jgi:hypothetical protein